MEVRLSWRIPGSCDGGFLSLAADGTVDSRRSGVRLVHVPRATLWLALGMTVSISPPTCTPADNEASSGQKADIVAVADDTGYQIEFQRSPARVISVAPNVTEIMFAIGAENKLIGVTDICNFPPAAKEKPKIGSFVSPNLEKIVSFEPDLVIGCGTLHPTLGRLRELGVRVLSFNPCTIDELLVMVEKIGMAVGLEDKARELTEPLQDEIEDVRSRVATLESSDRVRVFVELWHDPLMTAGAGSFVNDLVHTAGAINVAAAVGRHYFAVSHEHVLDADPQVILAAYMEKGMSPRDMILNRVTWRNVSAVSSGRVFDDIDPDLLLRPSVRAVHTVTELAERFYPELFSIRAQ